MPLCTLIDGIPSINCPSIGLLTLSIKDRCVFNTNCKAREKVYNIQYQKIYEQIAYIYL